MYRSRLLTFCFLLLAVLSYGQGFLKVFPEVASSANAVISAMDGGYFLAGEKADTKAVFIARTDATGQTLWQFNLSLNQSRAIAAAGSPDGGFVLLLENYQDNGLLRNVILKLNTSGAIEWTTILPNGNISNGLNDMQVLPDGSVVAVGNTRDINFDTRGWLVKCDASGAVLLDKVFGIEQQLIKKLVLLPGGDLAVAGFFQNYYLARLNANGDPVWENTFNFPGNQTVYDLLLTQDGQLALLGTSPGLSTLKIQLLKVGLNGQLIWNSGYVPFPNNSDALPVLNTFTQAPNGHFYIPFWGFIDDPLDTPMEVLQLSENGVALGKFNLGLSGNVKDILATADQRLVLTGNNNGVPTNAMLLKTNLQGQFSRNIISGHMYLDIDVDCALTPGETPLADFIVKAENAQGEIFYHKTDDNGLYEILVTEGDFTLTTYPAFALPEFYEPCMAPVIAVSGVNQQITAPDIMQQPQGACPALSLEVGNTILRRCTPTAIRVEWCNTGTMLASDMQIRFLKSPLLVYQSSSLPIAAQLGDTLVFNIGDILVGDCGVLNLQLLVDCNVNINDVLCMEAFLVPDQSCLPPNPEWDGSKIEVTGFCTGSDIEFTIKNTGLGNMTQGAEYVIIEDEIMYQQGLVQLNALQEMTTVRIPLPEDSCFALRVFPNQTTLMERPVAVVANCTADGNLGLLLALGNLEQSPVVATRCDQVFGPYDPNDKTGFPLGITPNHYIERGQEIDYRIRFQNTGNDTAFLVRILDTLPATLDPATIRPHISSHDYTWDLSADGVLSFTFPNIRLVDSTTNEPGSHGYIWFKISQMPGLPDGTIIDNTAAIYFDFNEPILTPPSLHTIGRPLTVATKELVTPTVLEVEVTPNPATDLVSFRLPGDRPLGPLEWSLYDPLGNKIAGQEFQGQQLSYSVNHLSQGIYFWQISQDGKTLNRGRVYKG
ncbi:MAG TPA: T9SS type A sorting domain-containing protein [Saprospiraceae bacterium]|nr:T9SS type A sorting domain-containing protein [Saprospiraceae bacterium]